MTGNTSHINKKPKSWRLVYVKNIDIVIRFIERYGDDGYGDKPVDMNRVEYWLAHIKF
jgi:hypothetical protein